ncbi:MAG TPA: hypothetical protein VF903_06560 [Nitrospirota bacterium]
MKLQAIIVLLAVGIGILLPHSLPLLACHDGRSSIGTLDVCHSAAPALSSNNMPCINESPCLPRPCTLTANLRFTNPSIQPFFIVQRRERPPEA